MAKTPYKPSAMLADPLAALRQATEKRTELEIPENLTTSVEALATAVSKLHEQEAAQEVEATRIEEPRPSKGSKLSVAPIKPIATTLKPTRNTVYLYPEDLTQLRKISGWLAIEHGIRANDSMIVRACLAMGDRDVRLLHAIKETALSDRRRTKAQ